MQIKNEKDMAKVVGNSRHGGFSVMRESFSDALGATKDQPPEHGGDPFAVERGHISPGKQNFPLHAHAAQWEFYMIESGCGEVLLLDEVRPIQAGDFFMCPPNPAHALRNTGHVDLVYLIIANNLVADLIHYPKSHKWMAKPGSYCFREQVDYFDGEE